MIPYFGSFVTEPAHFVVCVHLIGTIRMKASKHSNTLSPLLLITVEASKYVFIKSQK